MSEITGLCREHSFEPAIDLCRLCGGEFCELCLVHPGGRALCKTCAMAAAGVRSGGTLKPIARRDLKRRLTAFEAYRSMRRPAEASTPIIHDPLIEYDVAEPHLGAAGATRLQSESARSPDPDLVAQAAAQLAGSRRPLEPAARTDDSPGGDIAPPIDWSKPFG